MLIHMSLPFSVASLSSNSDPCSCRRCCLSSWLGQLLPSSLIGKQSQQSSIIHSNRQYTEISSSNMNAYGQELVNTRLQSIGPFVKSTMIKSRPDMIKKTGSKRNQLPINHRNELKSNPRLSSSSTTSGSISHQIDMTEKKSTNLSFDEGRSSTHLSPLSILLSSTLINENRLSISAKKDDEEEEEEENPS